MVWSRLSTRCFKRTPRCRHIIRVSRVKCRCFWLISEWRFHRRPLSVALVFWDCSACTTGSFSWVSWTLFFWNVLVFGRTFISDRSAVFESTANAFFSGTRTSSGVWGRLVGDCFTEATVTYVDTTCRTVWNNITESRYAPESDSLWANYKQFSRAVIINTPIITYLPDDDLVRVIKKSFTQLLFNVSTSSSFYDYSIAWVYVDTETKMYLSM